MKQNCKLLSKWRWPSTSAINQKLSKPKDHLKTEQYYVGIIAAKDKHVLTCLLRAESLHTAFAIAVGLLQS